MRVRLNYSLDAAEVPELIETMVSSIKDNLISCLSKDFDINNPGDFIKNAENVRATLFVVDTKLEECTKILAGLVQAHIQASGHTTAPVSAPAKEEDEEETEPPQDVKDA